MKSQIHFLTYLNRSGSTLLAMKLNEYNEIAVGIEARIVDGIDVGHVKINTKKQLDEYLNNAYSDPKFKSWNIEKNLLRDELLKIGFPIEFKDFLLTAFKLQFRQNVKIYIHKSGTYIKYIKKIKKQFPESKIIFINRDPRAIFNSQKKSIESFSGKLMESDPAKFASIYKYTSNILAKNKNNPDLYVINYEKLIKDANREMGKLLDFLKVDKILKRKNDNYYQRIPKEQKHLHHNLKSREIRKDRIYGWKEELEKYEIYFLQIALKREIKQNNYSFLKMNKLSKKDMFNIFILLIKYYLLFYLRVPFIYSFLRKKILLRNLFN